MNPLAWPLACMLAASSAAPVAPPQGSLLDRIVAVVDGQTVTQTELEAEARLALVRDAKDARAARLVVPNEAALHAFLDTLIGQLLIAREARRVGAEEVDDTEVDASLHLLRRSLGDEADWDHFLTELGVLPSFVRDVVRRGRSNERYLVQRLRTRLMGTRQENAATPQAAAGTQSARIAELQRFLPTYIAELRQSVEVRRLTAQGALERQPRR